MTPDRLLIALLVSIAIALGITIVDASASPATAHCAFCPDLPCWGPNQCGKGCSCLKRFPDPQGVCVSLE